MSELVAEIGAWYQEPGGQVFEVVAIDPDAATIEIQYCEGEVEELDFDIWKEMILKCVEPPEDWTGAYDDLEHDDLGYSDSVVRPENWAGPLGILETED